MGAKIYLIDMDGVIADFENNLLSGLQRIYPNESLDFLRRKKTFRTKDSCPEEWKGDLDTIINSEGFFENIIPVSGSIKALNELSDSGNHVFVCTTPNLKSKHCVKEKYVWVEKNLGQEWTKKVILTSDKTLVKGDYLIDDNPEITGIIHPLWEHILYDRLYNQHITNKRRLTWSNWKEVLKEDLK